MTSSNDYKLERTTLTLYMIILMVHVEKRVACITSDLRQ